MDQVCKEALQPDARVRQRSACDIELILAKDGSGVGAAIISALAE